MKRTFKTLALLTIVAFTTFSFTSNVEETKTVKTDKSTVTWKGYKVTGSHQGTIAIQSGTLKFNNETLIGGEFVIDMASLTNTDMEGDGKANLEGHLKSDDFFGVNNHPTATLVFKNVKANGKNSYQVTADLTIKGNTNAVNFDFSVYGSKATASLKVDRTKYNVKYGSASFF